MVAKSCTTLVETLEIMGCLPSINHQLVQDFAGPSIVLIDSAGFHRIGIEKVVPVPLSPQSLWDPHGWLGRWHWKLPHWLRSVCRWKKLQFDLGFSGRYSRYIYINYTYKSYTISRTSKPTNETWLNRDSTVTVASSSCVVMRFARTFLPRLSRPVSQTSKVSKEAEVSCNRVGKIWGFPKSWGSVNSWMVCFMENPEDLGVPIWIEWPQMDP